MALVNDLKEAKELWKKSSTVMRIFLVISTFLATSSLASLSDVVFKWKGFLLDGLVFYRASISLPLIKFCQQLELFVGLVEVDIFVIYMLAASAMYRKKVVEYNHHSKWLLMAFVLLTFGGTYIAFLLVISNFGLAPLVHKETIVGALALSVLMYPIYSDFDTSERISYYTPLALAVLSVLILAAVNSGLNMTKVVVV